MRNLVVAHSANRVIGLNKDIPWRGKMPADMRHFRDLTMGHSVIMGRSTYDSIGKPLPGRNNIVVSRSVLRLTGCKVARSLEEAFDEAGDESFVIGGAQIYAEAMPQVQRLFVTEIDTVCDGDTFFPAVSSAEWRLIDVDAHCSNERNDFDYNFLTYRRIDGDR